MNSMNKQHKLALKLLAPKRITNLQKQLKQIFIQNKQTAIKQGEILEKKIKRLVELRSEMSAITIIPKNLQQNKKQLTRYEEYYSILTILTEYITLPSNIQISWKSQYNQDSYNCKTFQEDLVCVNVNIIIYKLNMFLLDNRLNCSYDENQQRKKIGLQGVKQAQRVLLQLKNTQINWSLIQLKSQFIYTLMQILYPLIRKCQHQLDRRELSLLKVKKQKIVYQNAFKVFYSLGTVIKEITENKILPEHQNQTLLNYLKEQYLYFKVIFYIEYAQFINNQGNKKQRYIICIALAVKYCIQLSKINLSFFIAMGIDNTKNYCDTIMKQQNIASNEVRHELAIIEQMKKIPLVFKQIDYTSFRITWEIENGQLSQYMKRNYLTNQYFSQIHQKIYNFAQQQFIQLDQQIRQKIENFEKTIEQSRIRYLIYKPQQHRNQQIPSQIQQIIQKIQIKMMQCDMKQVKAVLQKNSTILTYLENNGRSEINIKNSIQYEREQLRKSEEMYKNYNLGKIQQIVRNYNQNDLKNLFPVFTPQSNHIPSLQALMQSYKKLIQQLTKYVKKIKENVFQQFILKQISKEELNSNPNIQIILNKRMTLIKKQVYQQIREIQQILWKCEHLSKQMVPANRVKPVKDNTGNENQRKIWKLLMYYEQISEKQIKANKIKEHLLEIQVSWKGQRRVRQVKKVQVIKKDQLNEPNPEWNQLSQEQSNIRIELDTQKMLNNQLQGIPFHQSQYFPASSFKSNPQKVSIQHNLNNTYSNNNTQQRNQNNIRCVIGTSDNSKNQKQYNPRVQRQRNYQAWRQRSYTKQ